MSKVIVYWKEKKRKRKTAMRPLDLFECGLGLHPAFVCLPKDCTYLWPSRWRNGSTCLRWAEPWDTRWQIYLRWVGRATEEPEAKRIHADSNLCLTALCSALTNEMTQTKKETTRWMETLSGHNTCFSSQIRIAHNTALQRTQSAWQTRIFYTGYYPKTQCCSGQNTHKDKHRCNMRHIY